MNNISQDKPVYERFPLVNQYTEDLIAGAIMRGMGEKGFVSEEDVEIISAEIQRSYEGALAYSTLMILIGDKQCGLRVVDGEVGFTGIRAK